MITSWKSAATAPMAKRYSNRNATYIKIQISAVSMAKPPCSFKSSPTLGPTNSIRRISTLLSACLSAAISWLPIVSALTSLPRGAKRTSTSWLEPNNCTDASAKPFSAKTERIFARSAGCEKPTSTAVPPVKSKPKFNPRIAIEAIDAKINNAEIAMVSLRADIKRMVSFNFNNCISVS